MYSEEELTQVRKLESKRLWIAVIPAVLTLAAAIGLFVYGQHIRSDQLWMVTAALSILSGCYFFFMYGLYVRPMHMYRVHIDCMLHGRRHESTGVLKAFDEKVSLKNEVECYSLILNVGQMDDGEDDRLFYYDIHKAKPDISLGTRISIQSNDMMVADFSVC